MVVLWDGVAESYCALSPADGHQVWKDDGKVGELRAVRADGTVRAYQAGNQVKVVSASGVTRLDGTFSVPVDAVFSSESGLIAVLPKLDESGTQSDVVVLSRRSSTVSLFDIRTGRLARTLDLGR
jgi:outer membrane protein assembly factor BamB